ncbi:MAG: type II secretion system F family protein [Alphaproteobacteria bacterium]
MSGDFLVLTVVGAGFGLLVTVLLPHWWWSSPAARLRGRLGRHVDGRLGPKRSQREVARIFERPQDRRENPLVRLVRAKFIHLGGTRTVNLVVLAAVALALAAAAGLVVVAGLDPPKALTAGLAVGFGAALLALRELDRRWQIAFLETFNDAIELIIRAVRSGIPVNEAIRQAGSEVNEPVMGEFRRIADSIDLGVDMREALRQAADRVALPDFDFFVVCLVLQRETGGQLTDTLEGLTHILRRRKEIRLKVRALTAEGRMTAMIVGALPVVVAGLMYVLDPDHILRLAEPGLGRGMLYYALGSMAVGVFVINQLTRVEA